MPIQPKQQPPYYQETTQLPIGYSYTEYTVTNAQILTLPNNYIEILPAPGTNKQIIIISCTIIINALAGAYTGVGSDNGLLLAYGDWNTEATGLTELIQSAALAWINLPLAAHVDDRATWQNYLRDSGTAQGNEPINLIGYNNADANFTGGNAANYLKLKIIHTTITL